MEKGNPRFCDMMLREGSRVLRFQWTCSDFMRRKTAGWDGGHFTKKSFL
jgi:hypothetical protein